LGGVNTANDPEAGVGRGKTIGRYVVLERLGVGAMGVVYSAYDPELARQVALKVLRPKAVAKQGAAAARVRLLREAQSLAQLAHPNVVSVYDVGRGDDEVFLAMELIVGENLRSWSRRVKGWREIVAVFIEAGRGLAAAHRLGLVHRDFKPENVLVAEDGRVCVTDFGLARPDPSVDAPSTSASEAVASRSGMLGVTMTVEGDAIGTPAYMAPEQHGSGDADARSDQYSFCVSLYEALYGRRPFTGDNEKLIAEAKAAHAPKLPPHRLDDRLSPVPAWLRRVLRRGMSRAARRRYGSMDDLLAELERGVASRPWVALGMGALTVGALAVGIAVQRSPAEASNPCASDRPVEPTPAWNAETQRALRMTLAGLEGEASFERVAERIDRRVEDWRATYRQTCEDTWVRGEQSAELLDARMSCLRRQWGALENTMGVLAEGDAGVAEHAAGLVDALPEPEQCRKWLVAAPRDMPAGGELRDRYDGLAAALAKARVLQRAGRSEQALELVLARQPNVFALGVNSLTAELLLVRGSLEQDERRYAAARVTLREALTAARTAESPRQEAEAWLGLAELADDPDRARFYARMAVSVAESVGGDEAIVAESERVLERLR